MGNETIFLRAFLWSILLGVIIDPRRLQLRGRGPAEARSLRILGYTAVLSALMFSLESPESFASWDVIRGGAAQQDAAVKRENPAFRVSRYGGTFARVLFGSLQAEFKGHNPFKVKQKGTEKEMTGQQIEDMVLQWFKNWDMEVSHSESVPMTPSFVARVLKIRAEIQEKKARVGRFGTLELCHANNDGYMYVLTETAQPILVAEDDVPDWVHTQYFIRLNVTVSNGDNVHKTITIDQLVEMVEEMMMKEKVEVYNEVEDKYEPLNQAGLKKLLDYEAPLRVNWENEWFMVTNDFFEFMRLRFEQAKNRDPNPKPAPASLKQYVAPTGFDPLELNMDGLFLVTPKMKELEAERPVFGFSYFHVRGYCAKGATPAGIPCELNLRERHQSFSVRGVSEIDKELDEIHFGNNELEMMPPALEASYAGNADYTAVREGLQRFYIALHEGDMSYLAQSFIARGKYLQQYGELRTFLSWMQKTLAVAEKLDFDTKMKQFCEEIDLPRTDQTVMTGMIADHLKRKGLTRPMLSCREATGMGPKRTLVAITVCLTRDYKPVDCLKDGNCDSSFHWVTPDQ